MLHENYAMSSGEEKSSVTRPLLRETGHMSTLVARGLQASFADVPVLHGVDVVVGPGSRLGLVGPNGAGKSTLLKALVGAVPLDAGTIGVTGTVGYLPQEPDRRSGETLLGYLGRRTGVTAADEA